MQGIYCIYNIINGKFYIGSTIQIESRWYNHSKELARSKHHSKYLQNSYNKYGKEIFQFHIIEHVENKNNLLNREQWWLDISRCYLPEIGYNTAITAGSVLGLKQTKEHIEKRIKRGYKQSPERAEKSRNARKGKLHSEATKAKMSKIRNGRKRPELRISKWPHELGNRCTCDECRKQRNLDQKKRYHAPAKFIRLPDAQQES